MARYEQITLYASHSCPGSHKVELALAEVGAQFTRYELDLKAKPDWFMSIVNPVTGKVQVLTPQPIPAITYGGPTVPADQPSPSSAKLTESIVILEFIADIFPASSIRPSSPVALARMRLFTAMFMEKYHPAYVAFALVGTPGSLDQILAALEHLQGMLPEGQKYAVGDEYTIADMAVAPYFARVEMYCEHGLAACAGGRGREFMDIIETGERFAKFRAYYARIKARESWKKAFDYDACLEVTKSIFAVADFKRRELKK